MGRHSQIMALSMHKLILALFLFSASFVTIHGLPIRTRPDDTGTTASWLGQHEGMKHFEILRSKEAEVKQCATRRRDCKPDVRKHLDGMIEDKDVVFFVDICIFYACRHAPYAKSLPICSNVAPEMKVVASNYRREGKVDYSDIAACANERKDCTASTHELMDSMVSRQNFTVYLNDLMQYLCEHAPYDIELATCTAVSSHHL